MNWRSPLEAAGSMLSKLRARHARGQAGGRQDAGLGLLGAVQVGVVLRPWRTARWRRRRVPTRTVSSRLSARTGAANTTPSAAARGTNLELRRNNFMVRPCEESSALFVEFSSAARWDRLHGTRRRCRRRCWRRGRSRCWPGTWPRAGCVAPWWHRQAIGPLGVEFGKPGGNLVHRDGEQLEALIGVHAGGLQLRRLAHVEHDRAGAARGLRLDPGGEVGRANLVDHGALV